MDYIEEIDSARRIIIARIRGDMTTDTLAPLSTATRMQARELRYGIIFDYRLATNHIGISDAFYWFSDHYASDRSELKRIPTAFIHKKEDHAFGSFAVTSLMNQGVLVSLFAEEEPAADWVSTMLGTPTAE